MALTKVSRDLLSTSIVDNGNNTAITIDSNENVQFSGTISATGYNPTTWDTAYSWGNHASQSYATQSYVNTQVANLVDSAPSTLDTLNELASALGDDPNFATTVSNNIGTKLPLAGGNITGSLTVASDLTVDTDTLYVDATNNRVGIGTSSPNGSYTTALHIHGSGTGASLHLTDPTSGATATDGLEVFQYGTDGYIWEREAGNLRFGTNATERMRIASSGNVGIGTSSPSEELHLSKSASGADVCARIQNSAVSSGDTATLRFSVTSNSSFDSAFVGSDRSNALILGSNTSERMRIDSSGRVGIGTSSPSRTFHSKGASGVGTVAKLESGVTTGTETVYLQLSSTGQSNTDSGYISYKNTREMGFWTVDTERMTIDSSGNVLVGGTSLAQADSLGITQTGIIYSARASGSGQSHNIFYNGSSVVGSITTTTSSTSYNTSSDYRLKENVVELTGATERLKQLKPSRFNFIADADTTVDGFLAHEVADIVPEAITGTKDAVDADGNPEYQGIDQSKLVPLLVATIKELEARITQLES